MRIIRLLPCQISLPKKTAPPPPYRIDQREISFRPTYMQPPPQLPVSAQLDENMLVERQANEVEGLLDRVAIVNVGHC